MTKLDYLLLERQWLKQERRSMNKWFVAMIAIMIMVEFIPSRRMPGPIGITFVSITEITGLCFMLKFSRLFWRQRNFDNTLDAEQRMLPIGVLTNSIKLYGSDSFIDAELAAIECHTSHIPGDCPLCGAT